mgnify:CR=1 FL=1
MLALGRRRPVTAEQEASLPDWTGIWEVDWANKRGIRAPRPQMKLTPEYQQRLDAYRKAQEKGENLQSEGGTGLGDLSDVEATTEAENNFELESESSRRNVLTAVNSYDDVATIEDADVHGDARV